jgi:hypothetical protein
VAAVDLGPKTPARGLVVATRMPPPPKLGTYTTPWESPGDVYAECDVTTDGKRCGYACSGERVEVGKAMRAHHRMFHVNEVAVVLLNQARQ